MTIRASLPVKQGLAFLAPSAVILTAVFLVPIVLIVAQSFTVEGHLSIETYRSLLASRLFLIVFKNTFEIAFVGTIVSLLMAYPVALHLSRLNQRRRSVYLIFVLLPFWTSILVKSFAFTVILGHDGIINQALHLVGLPTLEMMFNRVGVIVGTANYLIPFAVFPILSNLLAQNASVRSAAEVMGASRSRIFWQITFPQSITGITAASTICFVLSLGMFVTPTVLGGRKDMMMADLIDFYVREMLNWHIASAIAVILLGVVALLTSILVRVRSADGIV